MRSEFASLRGWVRDRICGCVSVTSDVCAKKKKESTNYNFGLTVEPRSNKRQRSKSKPNHRLLHPRHRVVCPPTSLSLFSLGLASPPLLSTLKPHLPVTAPPPLLPCLQSCNRPKHVPRTWLPPPPTSVSSAPRHRRRQARPTRGRPPEMATEGLVPITRAYLARYYDKYPLPPLPDAATALADRLRAISAALALAAAAPITPGVDLPLPTPGSRPRYRLLASPLPPQPPPRRLSTPPDLAGGPGGWNLLAFRVGCFASVFRVFAN